MKVVKLQEQELAEPPPPSAPPTLSYSPRASKCLVVKLNLMCKVDSLTLKLAAALIFRAGISRTVFWGEGVAK